MKIRIILLCVAIVSMTACKKAKKEEILEAGSGTKYHLSLEPSLNATQVSHVTTNISSGKLSIANATEEPSLFWWKQYINGTVYSTRGIGGGEFYYSKLALNENREMIETATCPKGVDMRYMYDIGNNQMLVLQRDFFTTPLQYEVLDVNSFTVVKTGTFPFETLPNSMIWPTGAVLKEDKIYVNYFHADDQSYASHDTAYALVVNRNTFEVEKTIKDTRTAALGLDFMQGAFVHTDGALYFSTCNTDFWGVNEDLPAAVIRIKAGETDFDDSYFFDVSAAVGGNHNIGLHPVGNGKALTKVFKREAVAVYDDFSDGYCQEFWVLDIVGKSAVKLDIPLSRSAIRTDFIEMGDNKYGIVANTQDGNFIYVYDSSSGSLTKGMEYVGGVIYEATPFK